MGQIILSAKYTTRHMQQEHFRRDRYFKRNHNLSRKKDDYEWVRSEWDWL